MKIYVGHSSSLEYEEELYEPLRQSDLGDEHDFVFPHEQSRELFDSKSFLREECDLFLAEVSEPSTGLGIELGWADMFEVSILCLYKEGSNPSSSLKAVTPDIKEYSDYNELLALVKEAVER